MVKTITSFMAIMALCFMTSSAFAAANTATAGDALTVTVSNVTGASDLTFQPSAQVSISCESSATSFAAEAGHDAVQGKDAGQNYGMASDSSTVFWVNAKTTAYDTVSATNSTAFSSWYKM